MKMAREIRLRVKVLEYGDLMSKIIALDQRSIDNLEVEAGNLVEISGRESLIVSINRELTRQVPPGYVLVPAFILLSYLKLAAGDEIIIRKFEPKELRLRVFPLHHRSRSDSGVVLNKHDFTTLSIDRRNPVEIVGLNTIITHAAEDILDDPDTGTILIDSEFRRRLGVQLNDFVTLRKAFLDDANYVEIALERGCIRHRPSLESWIKQELRRHNIIAAGDKIFLPFERYFSENLDGLTLLVKRTIPDKSCKMGFRTPIKLVGEECDAVPFYPTYDMHMTVLLECERILKELFHAGKAKKLSLSKSETENNALGSVEYPENPLDQLSDIVKSWLEKLIEKAVEVQQ